MKYKLVGTEQVRTVIADVASATVIAAGDLVGITAGLVVKAAAATAEIAWTPTGSKNGETKMEITVGNDFVLEGTADAVFAVAYKGTEVDINDTTQTIDVAASATDVLRYDVSENAGTVGSVNNVRVRINKPIF